MSCELEGVRLCPCRLPWLLFQWSLPQRHTTLPTVACLSAPARGLRFNPREWLQVVCIRFISVPFSVVCLVDGYDYTRSTNIAQVGLCKPLEILGFIGVSGSAYRAHVGPMCGAYQGGTRTCQAGRGADVAHGSGERDVRTCQGSACGADVVRGTRVIGTHTHALRARARTHIYARAHTYARVRVRTQRTHRGRGGYPV